MIEMLVGFGLGAMAFTATGRDIGNKTADFLLDTMKKAASSIPEIAKTTTKSMDEINETLKGMVNDGTNGNAP